MSESLANLFSSSSSGAVGGLFSESAKQKFARVYKPEEFDVPVKKVREPVEGEELVEDVEPIEEEKKKRKERKRKPEVSVDADGVEIPAVDATAGSSDSNGKDLDTIFVGSIPVTETQKSLTKFFRTYGEIDSIRLRSVPVAGAKVDEAGNQDLVRKVCVNAKKFGEQKGSFNAYIKFKEASSATAALAVNNQLMGERHLRVDRSNPTLFDPKRSVFLGGLPHYADEEDIREYFAKSLVNGHDDIEGMRIIRDPATLVGKGIGYILFKDRDCVLKALSLHKSVYKKRWALRVSACGKRTKRTEHAKVVKEGETAEGAEGEAATAEEAKEGSAEGGAKQATKPYGNARSNAFSSANRDKGGRSDDRSGKRQRGPETPHPAQRRVKHKTVVTRNKLLKERKQKKEKGRHGKRLGGVVKRALKAQGK